MIDNDDMFYKAKHESEIDFCNCLTIDNIQHIHKLDAKVKFVNILHNHCKYDSNSNNDCISTKLDCIYHVDALAHGLWHDSENNEKMTQFNFDIKDVEDKNISTGNYTVKLNEVEFLEKSTDAYYLAFRLNDGISKKFSKYVVVNGKELCARKESFIDKGTHFLVPLAVIRKCIDKFEVQGDF